MQQLRSIGGGSTPRVTLRPTQIATGCVYPATTLPARSIERGLLPIVVMRYWPRYLAREGLFWGRSVAPSPELLRAYRTHVLDWGAFAARYTQETRPLIPVFVAVLQQRLDEHRTSHPESRGVLLLCCERAETPQEEAMVRCHRRLLATLVRAYLSRL